MKKIFKQAIIICMLIYAIFNLACQALNPIPITKFSTFIDTSNVSFNTANVTSKFMDVGQDVISYGHCWNKTQNPTIDDFKTSYTGLPRKQVEFTSKISGLESGTLYYIRAYFSTIDTTIYSNDIVISSNKLTDIDNSIYKVVTYGNQIWMAENLKTTRYNNGYFIWTTDPATKMIVNEIEPKYQWALYGLEGLVPTYGRLYTWYAASDSICPKGWHLPSDHEWTALIDYLTNNGYGYEDSGDDIAKSLADTTCWILAGPAGSPGNDLKTNNSSGFSALPGGLRLDAGAFLFETTQGNFWSSTDFSGTEASYWYMNYNDLNLSNTHNLKDMGFSVRCVKD